MPALGAILTALIGVGAKAGEQILFWIRVYGWRAIRAARALAVWAAAHVSMRAALLAASVAAFEVFTVLLTRYAITPLASSFLRTCIPPGSAGDGLVWILWDTGLNGRALFSAFVLYISNYTLIWRGFDTWLRAQSIALATYDSARRRSDALERATRL